MSQQFVSPPPNIAASQKMAVTPVAPMPKDFYHRAYPYNVPSDDSSSGDGKTKFIALIITVISITAAAVVWAASSHEKIKDWTIDRDYDTKVEIEKAAEKYYVPLEDFIEVKTEQRQIKEKVDDIDKKVDEIHQFLMEKPRTTYSFEGKANGLNKRRNQ